MQLRLVVSACLLAFITSAHATVTQVDGSIVPVLNAAGAGCDGVGGDNLQVCFNNNEGVSPPNVDAIDAITDAAQFPEIFLPNMTMLVTFRDQTEGAGFENSFGYYNVGDDVSVVTNLHPILGCGVTAAPPIDARHHSTQAGGYVVNSEPGSIASVDFTAEQTAGRYKGGFIAFYLITPEANPSSTNCGDFKNGADNNSLFGHIYYTQRDLNDDGDFVHHLVYSSKLVPDLFYFGFEDLFRGGDNDFEDMLLIVEGLTPPCVPEVEVCDGQDNDCDGLVDVADPNMTGVGVACTCDDSLLPCQGGAAEGICLQGTTACTTGVLECLPSAAQTETCDLEDDNCNGLVDDNPTGAGVPCDGTDADLCTDGTMNCVLGTLLCSDDVASAVEICNGADDDCDGPSDEGNPGGGATCDGADGDLCQEGTTTCTAGALTCSDATSTTSEICNGADDDCDGTPDDSPSGVGQGCAVGVGACRRTGAVACTGGSPVCNVTAGTPTSELCNLVDDDCDGQTNEGYNLGAACDGVGACGAGVIECGTLTGTRCSTDPGGSASGVTPEICNGVDDDCDGFIDEGLADLGACGIATGDCTEGRQRCIGGAPVCVGSIGATPEVCDGRDNDCDGTADDAPIDEGATCGRDTGACEFGHGVCTDGTLVCTGGVGPAVELCNGADDDCDAITDNNVTDDDLPCGASEEGECGFGRSICQAGALHCAGEVGPTQETCNGLDDDCDGVIDDDALNVGAPCGTFGSCTPGTYECAGGDLVCVGGGGAAPETCNGIDDDCNGVIDDDPSDVGEPCGPDVPPCEPGLTFCIAGRPQCVGGVVPTTEICNTIDDDCDTNIDEGNLCEGGACVDGECAAPCVPEEFPCPPAFRCEEGFCVSDPCHDVECTPLAGGGATACEEGVCVPICDTVSCTSPFVCRGTDGACVQDDCRFFPEYCSGEEVCLGDTCVLDRCRDVTCGTADEFCRDGECVQSCAGVDCDATSECRGGACVATGCSMACGSSQVCDPVGGNCVNDPCDFTTCGIGLACEPLTGDCIADPCTAITCPTGAVCQLGECTDPPVTPGNETEYVSAAGGGGCAVARRGQSSGGWLFVLVALVAGSLRASRRRLRALAVLLLVGSTIGCAVDGYPVGGGSVDGGADAVVALDGQLGVDSPDGGPCVEEICNGVDDDCDGFADEGFDLTSDERNCGECGTSCALTGSRTECIDSRCEFTECFPGNVDANGDAIGAFASSDGCEYACFFSNGGAEACDGLDNDCDQDVDEDFDLSSSSQHCGACNRACAFFQVSNTSCVLGDCAFDPATDCTPGFIDVNGVELDGCEYACAVTNGGAEACDFLDNDCNGQVDDGIGAGTTPDNCGLCGRVCSFPNATPRCLLGGCTFDPTADCDPGFNDVNGNQLDGCEYACSPTNGGSEICDGLDNDCDAVVDDATSDAGASCNGAPGGTATGPCTQTGIVTCVGGSLACIGAPGPSSEICDGLDNDCDGTSDDAPLDVGSVCLAPVGACSAGILVCSGGARVCRQDVPPAAETCNGLDDDCDGTVDELPTDAALGTACGTAVGPCETGTNQCLNGSILCVGGVGPTSETCNNIDDDCDGVTDDNPIDIGTSCGSDEGSCVSGSSVCVLGALQCQGGLGAATETCNGGDDDCDGSIDEALSQACYTGGAGTQGVGPCRGGTASCTGGAFGSCVGQVLPVGETCDNVDNDCDGAPDDGVTRACYTGAAGTNNVGRCHGGTQGCTAGVFGGACVGQVTPIAESCNALDDDCDGVADEAAGGGLLTQSCYAGPAGTSGVGICTAGTRTCSFGTFGACTGQRLPGAGDFCGDNLDTDCDGLGDVAEGCLGIAGGELRLDAPGGGQGSTPGQYLSFDVSIASAGSPAGQNVYAVWTDRRNGQADVFFRRSTDGGQTFGTITNLTNGSSNASVKPIVVAARDAAIGQDRVYVVYQTFSGADVREIWHRRSSDSGGTFTSEARLDTSTESDTFHHDVALSSNGTRLMVVWERLNTTTLSRDIIARSSTNSGGTFAAQRQVNLNSGGGVHVAGRPQAVVTSSGRFVVAWRERRAPGATFNIYGTWNDGTGSFTAGDERRLDNDTGGVRESDLPRMVAAAQNVFVTWQDSSTASGSDVMFARSTTNAVSWSTEVIIDDPSGEVSSSATPSIAVDPLTASATDDAVAIAWRDTRDGSQVFVARSSDAGATFAVVNRASNANGAPVTGVSSNPRIASVGTAAWVVAYQNDGAGASHVYAAATVDNGVTWQLTDLLLDGGAGGAVDPVLAKASGPLTMGAAIAWSDFRPGVNGDPYLRRFGR